MPEYDAENFDPPAPVAYVTLRNPATGTALHNVPMLIDTSADATAVPITYIDNWALSPIKTKSMKQLALMGNQEW